MNKHKIVFATNNTHKLREIRELITDFEILSLSDINCYDHIPETADTLEGNAILKADYITHKYGLNCFSDDTGLEVAALNNAPGVFSARYAGPDCSAGDNIEKLLNALSGSSNRQARFRTAIALNINGKQHIFEGICDGKILDAERGIGGFGYDPIFQPVGFELSFAEMSSSDKGKISHRGLAVQKLINFLKEYTW